MTFRKEFPDYDGTLPDLPMADESASLDQCPVMRGDGLELWVDYVDPAKRKVERKRFTLRLDPEFFYPGETVCTTDSIGEVKAAIEWIGRLRKSLGESRQLDLLSGSGTGLESFWRCNYAPEAAAYEIGTR